ncbi:MAG: TIGR03084 family metal-binding protein [Rhizobiaceae bacterium]|nr:TIGR03084 family metal-binding protein [Rhizobiaceae bacterium]
MQQASDFLEESQALAAIIESLDEAELKTTTLFMDWTIEDIVGHLHMFNHAANLALREENLFQKFFAPIAEDLNKGKSLLSVQRDWLGDTSGIDLVNLWKAGYRAVANGYGDADPKTRIAWAGPDMSARSSITARQMETWAHGQGVFDVLGLVREDKDRIKNIVHLGVNTFGWTFINRKQEVPQPAPHVVLNSPSGETWQWNEPQGDNLVSGSAVEFCQVVTQTRNIDDTNIKTIGDIAGRWMANAQCFAGPPVEGPKPGERYRVTS